MKKMKLYKKIVLSICICMGFAAVSCDDFLTIYPTNSIVLENYWKEKADVEGMVATCYKTMLGSGFISRAIVWGELRSDNLIGRTGSVSTELKYIIEANLLPENSYCNWAVFYQTINYCNMVLKYAPGVVDEDPDFTEGDLANVEGQMYAIRALCHFYLVRTFRDIPLAREAMVDDSQERIYTQVDPLVALDSIMYDLKLAENLVLRSGSYTENNYNKGYITRDAVRAIMADVSLWQAAFTQYKEGSDTVMSPSCIPYYDQCIVYCDSVINAMNLLQETALKKANQGLSVSELNENNPYYLIQESNIVGTQKTSNAYSTIFGSKNSTESIFELQFDGDNNANSTIPSFYGYSATTGTLLAGAFLASSSVNEPLFETSDLRLTSFMNSGSSTASSSSDQTSEVTVAKYATRNSPAATGTYRPSSENDANWIIYRKTDVMLMKAEALAIRNGEGDLSQAFQLVKAVNDRSITIKADSLIQENYQDQPSIEKLVLEERQRELMFEGKRWYDLVRKALREHTTTNVLTWVVRKLESNASAVQSKMASMNTLFFPIYEGELDVNPLLIQNEAYETSSSIQKN